MCTAVTYHNGHCLFGRTLDYDIRFGESVTVTPRCFPLPYRHQRTNADHYAIVGMSHRANGYPLYYDAVNEKGLAMAGLNFVGNAVYGQLRNDRHNIASFELIPWVLSQCADLREAKALLAKLWIVSDGFSAQLPPAQLHWLIGDPSGSVTVEMTHAGLQVYDNPIGVLTNNPTFPEQLLNLTDYMQLNPGDPENRFGVDLKPYSRGMGAIGLPGDLSSKSRFVRAAFGKLNSVSGQDKVENIRQFFHILGTVQQIRGCCRLPDGGQEITQYTSCCDTDAGIYYYTTYENSRITGVNMHLEDLDGSELISYPLEKESAFVIQNEI